jgi:hypothetical protein
VFPLLERKRWTMGAYVNPDNDGFQTSVNSRIYVDKTDMIEYTNMVMDTEEKYICVSRPRRFGKSMAAKMLAAYYSRGCDSKELFQYLNIAKVKSFGKNLNQCDVLYLDIQWFRSIVKGKGISDQLLFYIQTEVIGELAEEYPEYVDEKAQSLPEVLGRLYTKANKKFIIIIDEWDCIFREDKNNTALQEEFITFLRGLFKGGLADKFVKLAYITGILPIKKYGTQSALNNFDEYSMTDSGFFARYVGFTADEVDELCRKYGMDFAEAQQWYDGYCFTKAPHIYNPRSIVKSMLSGEFGNYWTETETYESLKGYINLNYSGLKDSIISMLGGGVCEIDTGSFQNDMTSFKNKDDIMTLLVHLGYLSYDKSDKKVYIPNEEIREEFLRVVKNGNWDDMIRIVTGSKQLLDATIMEYEDIVASKIQMVHEDSTSILNYNDENALSCVITLAYISARTDYIMIREMPSGKGFADIVFLPKRNSDKPAIVVELKWNKSLEGAISQIEKKNYVKALENYGGKVLLVGVNYDKRTKEHQCRIKKCFK